MTTITNDTAIGVLATMQKCSAREKDVILAELLRDKWRREWGGAIFLVEHNSKPGAGFCMVIDPAIPSTLPPFTAKDLQEIQESLDNPDDSFTTEEAIEFLDQE